MRESVEMNSVALLESLWNKAKLEGDGFSSQLKEPTLQEIRVWVSKACDLGFRSMSIFDSLFWGPKWARSNAHFAQNPPAQILKRDQMASPPAEESPEDHGEQDGNREEDQSGIDHAVFGKLHGLGGLQRGHARAFVPPVSYVSGNQDMNADEYSRPVAARFRGSNGDTAGNHGKVDVFP